MIISKEMAVDFLRFGLIGFLGFGVDTAFLYGAMAVLDVEPLAAGFIAFPFAVTFTWLGNRLYTFRDLEHESLSRQWVKFVAVCTVGIVFNRGAYTLSVLWIPFCYDYPVVALVIGTMSGMFFNFLVSRKFVFAKT